MNQQLSWRTIVGYSLGDVANNFAFAMGALFLLSYYTDVAGVGAAAAGTMLLLVRVFDAFADRLCRTSGGQCEYPLGKIPPVFTLRYCAVNDLQRAGILGTDRLEP
ncbi:hypothetical protein VEE68_43670 [Escherichia coli]|nr:hypothetical protein VEE68_43670 [Escherichia coli]